jgi:hypothetical protein
MPLEIIDGTGATNVARAYNVVLSTSQVDGVVVPFRALMASSEASGHSVPMVRDLRQVSEARLRKQGLINSNDIISKLYAPSTSGETQRLLLDDDDALEDVLYFGSVVHAMATVTGDGASGITTPALIAYTNS